MNYCKSRYYLQEFEGRKGGHLYPNDLKLREFLVLSVSAPLFYRVKFAIALRE